MSEIELKAGYIESFDGAKIYYEMHGTKGEPIFFVYGIACLFNHWNKQISFFGKDYQTFMYDYRGHHKSPIPQDKNTLTINALAQDLLALKKHFGINSAHIVAHSFGTQIALEAYGLDPSFFKSLTLINGFYKNPFQRYLDKKIIQEGINGIIKLYNKSPAVAAGLWKNLVSNPLLIPISNLMGGFNLSHTKIEDIQIYSNGVSQLDIRVFLTFFSEMINFNGLDIIKNLTCPTLVIGGSNDSITPPSEQEKFVEINPNIKHINIADGSHCVQLDFPEQVNELILSQINSKL